MTVNLLKAQTNSIELYENPAQQVLPKVVRQGVSLLALGLSAAAETLHEPLQDMREMIRSNDFPASAAVGAVASSSVEKLGHLRSYVFPPLIKFKTVPAAEFQPLSTNAPPGMSASTNNVVQVSSPAGERSADIELEREDQSPCPGQQARVRALVRMDRCWPLNAACTSSISALRH